MSYAEPVLPDLSHLSRDELVVLAQDTRASRSDPIPAETLAAQKLLWEIDVAKPRTERRLRSVDAAIRQTESPPFEDVEKYLDPRKDPAFEEAPPDWTLPRDISDISDRTGQNSASSDLSSLSSHMSQAPKPWPAPPDSAAFAGLAGEMVDLSDPHTEADRVAVLAQHIVAFGNAIGSAPHVMVGATRHGANTYAALVGDTSKARKGDSMSPVRALYEYALPDWIYHRAMGGLGSGEALIWAVRDPVQRVSKEGEIEDVDPGEEDKRLLIYEPELARVLRVAGRQGSTLSMIIRDAWDRGDLRTMTKNSPARATGAHVSIVGHSTVEELRRELADTEAFNGFANRFLWLVVKRSKLLPEPEPFEGDAVVKVADKLANRIGHAAMRGRIQRNAEAKELWAAEYPSLAEGRPGLAGAVLARAEAHVLRLSLIYALLDGAAEITADHLGSALALWGYVERSVDYLFGDASGDPVADTIMRALKATEATELSRTQIRDLFGRHETADRISEALGILLAAGRARTFTRETGGRPVEVWVAA